MLGVCVYVRAQHFCLGQCVYLRKHFQKPLLLHVRPASGGSNTPTGYLTYSFFLTDPLELQFQTVMDAENETQVLCKNTP